METDEIARAANERARKIIASTEIIRTDIRKSRPNSSEQSTTEGTLRTLSMILDAAPNQLPIFSWIC